MSTVRRRRPVVLSAIALGSLSATAVPVLNLLGVTVTTDVESAVRICVDVLVAVVAAALLGVVAVRRHGNDRHVWSLLAVGTAGWATGSLVWAGYLRRGEPLPVPSPADIAYMAFPVLWCVALVIRSSRDPRSERGARSTRALDLVDGSIVALSTMLLLWILAFNAAGIDPSETSTIITMLYPVAASVTLTLLIRTARRVSTDRRSFSLLTAGMAVYVTGDLGFLVVTQLTDLSQAVPTSIDTAWVAAFSLIAGGAWIAMPGDEPEAPRHHRRERAVTPIALGCVAVTAALVDLTQRDGPTWTVATLVLIMLLILMRQTLTLSANRQMSTDLVSSVRATESEAAHDRLTGLANRRYLTERLQSLIDARTAQPSDGRVSAVMFLDIDMLKPVNDSLGHAMGDRLIRLVAERLRNRWGDDVVRFGGDEFVVLLRTYPSTRSVEREASRLAQDMRASTDIDGSTLQPSVSVGVTIVDADTTPTELLRRADVALYHAKSIGKGCSALYGPDIEDGSAHRIALASDLERALEHHELELHYQPVVRLHDGRVCGAEALLRWRHPEQGMLTPDRFLAEADALGLLPEIGRRSLIEATARFAEANDRSPGPDLYVTVNLSASELGPDVLTHVDQALGDSGLRPELLVLEITEDVIIDEGIRRTLVELRRRGVGIAIDDFGTGNSSLRQLGDYPASVLKIDRSFVSNIGSGDSASADDSRILEAVAELAGRMGMTTVVEGVETVQQAASLAVLGYRNIQGWLVERALPFDQLDERWLQGEISTERVLRRLGRSSDDDVPISPGGSTLRTGV